MKRKTKKNKGPKTEKTQAVQIPEEILVQILEKLPTKSLLKCKCVSKHWCSLIEDPEFVDAFRVRSLTNILVRKNCYGTNQAGRQKRNEFSLVDLGGTYVPLAVPEFLEEKFFTCTTGSHRDDDDITFPHPVEGLVRYNNIIWNPTTKKILNLPPRKPNAEVTKMTNDMDIAAGSYTWFVSGRYFLGFDVSTKKYKVLSLSRSGLRRYHCTGGYDDGYDIVETLVYAEVLTLGTNSWRNSYYSLPEELPEQFNVRKHCYIRSSMYFVVSAYGRQQMNECILTFDVTHEKFQLLSLPDGVESVSYAYEVGERFALMDWSFTKIWILQDLESGNWTVEDILWPSWVDDQSNRPYLYNRVTFIKEPVGSIQTGEVLFKIRAIRQDAPAHSACYCYDIERKDLIKLPQLGLFSYEADIYPKFVESIHPLK